MGLVDSLKGSLGMGSQGALKDMENEVVSLSLNLSGGEFKSEQDMKNRIETMIDDYSGDKLKPEEVAVAAVYGISIRVYSSVTGFGVNTEEQKLRYFDAAIEAIREVANEYDVSTLSHSHRPHVIAYALYHLDKKVSRKANKHRTSYAKKYKKAEEKGNQEEMQKYEQLIEDELQEEMSKRLENLSSAQQSIERYQ